MVAQRADVSPFFGVGARGLLISAILALCSCAAVGPLRNGGRLALRSVTLPGVGGVLRNRPDAFEYSTAAYPFDRDSLKNREVFSCFVALLESGGYGMRPEERAAFLVLREDGSLRALFWPATHGYMREEWSGPIPRGAVAIAHTHPALKELPSQHDSDEAVRIGIPVFVITPGAVSMASPRDGKTVMIVNRRRWWAEE